MHRNTVAEVLFTMLYSTAIPMFGSASLLYLLFVAKLLSPKKLEGAVSSKTVPEVGPSKGGDIEVLMECDLGVVDFCMNTHALSGSISKDSEARRDLEELCGMRVVGNAWTGEVWCVIWEVEAAKVGWIFRSEVMLRVRRYRF